GIRGTRVPVKEQRKWHAVPQLANEEQQSEQNDPGNRIARSGHVARQPAEKRCPASQGNDVIQLACVPFASPPSALQSTSKRPDRDNGSDVGRHPKPIHVGHRWPSKTGGWLALLFSRIVRRQTNLDMSQVRCYCSARKSGGTHARTMAGCRHFDYSDRLPQRI